MSKKNELAAADLPNMEWEQFTASLNAHVDELFRRQRENQEAQKEMRAQLKDVVEAVGGTIDDEEPPPRVRKTVKTGGKRGGGSGWTLATGTMELLRRYHTKGGLGRWDVTDKFTSELGYEHRSVDRESFGSSLYVSGINKCMKEDCVKHTATGKYMLTPLGLKLATKTAKEKGIKIAA